MAMAMLQGLSCKRNVEVIAAWECSAVYGSLHSYVSCMKHAKRSCVI